MTTHQRAWKVLHLIDREQQQSLQQKNKTKLSPTPGNYLNFDVLRFG